MSEGKRRFDWITKYLEYEENSEPPLLYKEWIAMSVIAAALQRKCKLPWGGKGGKMDFYPNLYIVLVGPAGKCRKGTAMKAGRRFLTKLGIKIAAESITREALIRELDGSKSDYISPDGNMKFHSSLTVFSGELAVFLGYDNNTLLMDLTDWYDCADTWTYRTKTQGEDELIGIWLNLVGATTPEQIKNHFSQDFVGAGLASRIIFVYEEEKSKVVPLPFAGDEYEKLFEELKDELGAIQGLQGNFTWTEEFVDKWVPWYMANEKYPSIDDERFRSYIERRPNHLLKTSMILCASSRTDMVLTGEIFDRARDLLERTEKKMAKTFSGHGEAKSSDIIRKIMEYIGRKKKTSRSEIMTSFYYDLGTTEELDKILNTLRTIGFIGISVSGDETNITYKDRNSNKEA